MLCDFVIFFFKKEMPPDTPDIVASLTQAQLDAKAKSDRVIDELQLLAAQYAQRDFNRSLPISL